MVINKEVIMMKYLYNTAVLPSPEYKQEQR